MDMKRGNKAFALIFCSLLIGIFLIGVVSAQDGFFENFIEKWKSGQGFNDLEAKITLGLIITVIISIIMISLGANPGLSIILSVLISFLFTAYISPDALTGLFRSFDIVPMTIAIILPLALFFGFSAFAGLKGSRTLITAQLVLWGIAFFLYSGQLFIELTNGWFGWWGGGLLSTASLSAGQQQYWWLVVIAGAIISALMTFLNGFFMNFALKLFAGVKGDVAEANTGSIISSIKGLKKIGKELEGEKRT